MTTTRANAAPSCAQLQRQSDDLPLGAHVVTSRRGYTHHGIHVGGGRIVHYAGLCRLLNRGPVEETSFAVFARGRRVFLRRDLVARYPAEVVVERARSRLGEDRYRIATNNCEHFCVWCQCGESRSEQVERVLAWPRAAVDGLGSLVRAARAVLRMARVSARKVNRARAECCAPDAQLVALRSFD